MGGSQKGTICFIGGTMGETSNLWGETSKNLTKCAIHFALLYILYENIKILGAERRKFVNFPYILYRKLKNWKNLPNFANFSNFCIKCKEN